jgi:VWFA-related protein
LLALLIVPSHTPAQENTPPLKIEQDVSLVTLTATVIDRSGRYVAGLEKGDFRIYEDDVPQKLAVLESEEAPASIGVVFDTSGSMVHKIDDVQDAVKHFVADSGRNSKSQLCRTNATGTTRRSRSPLRQGREGVEKLRQSERQDSLRVYRG